MIELADVEQTARLIAAFVRSLNEQTSFIPE
jgi:putative aminopeptidase FrvX